MNQLLKSHVDKIVIPHTVFQSGLAALDLIYEYSAGIEPTVVPIIGPSRSGKSTIVRQFSFMHPPSVQDEGVQKPILSILTPATPSQIGLARGLLTALGDPMLKSKEPLDELTLRLIGLIKNCGVKAIILDEIQHFIAQRGVKSVNAAADWIKNLVEETKVLLILSGLPYALDMLYKNDQLEGRSISPIKMPHYSWSIHDSKEEFCAVLSAFTEAMSPFSLPDLGSEEMAFRFQCASDGLIGHVVKILRFASWVALKKGSQIITLDELKAAYEISSLKRGHMGNPFSRDFSLGINLDDLPSLVDPEDMIFQQRSQNRKISLQKELASI